MNKFLITMTALAGLFLAACSADKTPLVFSEQRMVGINLGNNPASGSFEASLGYKKNSLFVTPVITEDGELISATESCAEAGDELCEDTFSAIGQFEVDIRNNQIGLGEFFGTGFAARILADGFREKMKASSDEPDDE